MGEGNVRTDEAQKPQCVCQIIDDLFYPGWSQVPVGGAEVGQLQLRPIFPLAGGEAASSRSVTRLLKSPWHGSPGATWWGLMVPFCGIAVYPSFTLIREWTHHLAACHSKNAPHIGADQSSKQGGAIKRPSCVGSNFPDWMSVRNVCVAAGRKVGHRLKDHCLAHIRPLF